MSATVDTVAAEITGLQAKVASNTSVVQSAVTLISGFSAQLAAAVAAAQVAGATPTELSALFALQTQIDSNNQALAQAVATNTPSAPTP